MLTLRQYLDQFTRKEHTAEMHRLVRTIPCTRQNIHAMAKGTAASLKMALDVYAATHGRVDPRTIARNFNWGALDAYYRQEQGIEAPATVRPAVARAGHAGVAVQAGARVQRAGSKAGPAGAKAASRKSPARAVK